jgi:hypothetical protein
MKFDQNVVEFVKDLNIFFFKKNIDLLRILSQIDTAPDTL